MNPQYRQFKIERLDTISATFCAAKWLTTDIYLHTGVTSSCQLPTPGPIDLDAIQHNALAVHNTQEKIAQRRMMLQGQQPSKCESCWNVENQDSDVASHRIVTSHMFAHRDLSQLDLSDTVVPEMVTLMFDNLCNFTCTYCDATQSTSWATDLKVNGPYVGVKNDPKKTYLRLGIKDRLSDSDRHRLMIKVKQMIFDHLPNIRYLRFLGGEPTMSPEFWQFLDELAEKDCHNLTVQIVTNLSFYQRILKFVDHRSKFKDIVLFVSIDGQGYSAEFIRKGLSWKDFESSISDLLEHTDIKINFLGTINVLAMDALLPLLDWIVDHMHDYPDRLDYDAFLVKQPVFQTIDILPQPLKDHYANAIIKWRQTNNHRFHAHTRLADSVDRLIVSLQKHTDINTVLQKDFRVFINEFSRRHHLTLGQAFSKNLLQFIDNT